MKRILINIAAFALLFTAQAGNKSWFDAFQQWGSYVSSIPHVVNAFYYDDTIFQESSDAGPHTQQFVKDLLALYYPEIDINKVHILCNQRYVEVPFVMNDSGEFYIVVPITDRALLCALNEYLDAHGQERVYLSDENQLNGDGRDLFCTEDKLPFLAFQEGLSIDVVKELLYLKFQFLDAVLFPLHVGLLIHEGAHILHNDGYHRLVHSSVTALAGFSIFAGEMMYRTYIRNFIEGAADQEAADRIDSIVVTEALVDFFNNFSYINATSEVLSWFALGTHPAAKKRAEVFAECARNIEDSEDSKFERLIELTCSQFRSKLGES